MTAPGPDDLWTLEHIALAAAELGAWDWHIAPNTVSWSDGVYRIFGLEPGTFAGTVEAYQALIHPDDRDVMGDAMTTALAGGQGEWFVEHRLAGFTPERWVSCRGRVFRDDTATAVRMAGVVQDITARRAAEEALRQAQKLEAIGRLAGGVAHDFNNLLTVILALSALMRRSKALPPELDGDLAIIIEAGERGAALTQQLLAFGRRDASRPTVFDVRASIGDAVRLIERAVGPSQVVVEPGDAACVVKMDERQLHQVLLNLALNARDAMPDGGRILIAAAVVVLDGASVPGLAAGRYARLAVRDDGVGMDDATRHRALEPFFTTKPAHEGTGLGLSTCHGIILQAGGALSIDSRPGRGTTVTIHLPLVDGPASAATCDGVAADRSGQGHVLVVEDEPAVRAVAVRTLELAGYAVHAAATGREALAIAHALDHTLDLIVCDVVLPGSSGFDVIAGIRERRTDIPVLYVSGFIAEVHRIGTDAFLAKPYAPGALSARVGELLAGRERSL
ncbi:MAG: ATP-binding protein [Myxococcota bacterium]|nr:ATP-binding protein [Myxococcota bacterium]